MENNKNVIAILEDLYDAYHAGDEEEFDWLVDQALLAYGISPKGVFWVEWVSEQFSNFAVNFCEGTFEMELMLLCMEYLSIHESEYHDRDRISDLLIDEVSRYSFVKHEALNKAVQ
ncbi:hypothetical protein [Fictibacillus fluitans]|uniref:CdiI immunity protein domain-containing protein n=1 Tax=Fictibacillus fluitans TaxID=3058422 RepID=A0ABT8HR09_9BACL|nr:hypothetical protein [Fictibacillus sp. NE201]MDN4523181.1 hypothetical protein [Fictibacillus sp. NE201]